MQKVEGMRRIEFDVVISEFWIISFKINWIIYGPDETRQLCEFVWVLRSLFLTIFSLETQQIEVK